MPFSIFVVSVIFQPDIQLAVCQAVLSANNEIVSNEFLVLVEGVHVNKTIYHFTATCLHFYCHFCFTVLCQRMCPWHYLMKPPSFSALEP